MVGTVLRGDGTGRGIRVGLACSGFNGSITWRLLEGALSGLDECGVDRSDVKVAWAPGAFELPLVAKVFVTHGAVDVVVCLGAVIRGETGHYDLVAGECAAGVQRVQLDSGVPVTFGVVTTETLDQALERSKPGPANKGREAAVVAVEMYHLVRSVMI
ncbi:MAG: 6,7-dimethyl-8-ribityllumazine synthase [Acidimicrobiales bacterium]